MSGVCFLEYGYTLNDCRLCQRSLIELSEASCRYWDNEGVCCWKREKEEVLGRKTKKISERARAVE